MKITIAKSEKEFDCIAAWRIIGEILNKPESVKPENIYVLCNASTSNVMFAINSLTEIANRMIPKNLRII